MIDIKTAIERTKRFQKYLPWLSLGIGIISGLSISNDFSHATRFSVYLTLGIVVLYLIGSVFRAKETSFGLHPFVVTFVLLIAQSCVQYLLFYSIPLLYFSSAWFCLAATVVFAAISVWDPWWESFAKHKLFRMCLRTWTTLLGVSFLWAVLFADWVEYYYLAISVIALIISFPYGRKWAQNFADRVLHFIPFAIGFAFAAWQLASNADEKMPLMSIWTENPTMGFGIKERHVVEELQKGFLRAQLQETLQSGRPLCCQTPIVGPLGLQSNVTHEWRVNGVVVDRIELPKISGNASRDHAFRTFSCKNNLGEVEKIETLTCVAYIGANIFIGKVERHSDAVW